MIANVEWSVKLHSLAHILSICTLQISILAIFVLETCPTSVMSLKLIDCLIDEGLMRRQQGHDCLGGNPH